MGIYLNSKSPSDAYKAAASEKYFVDKSALIAELIPALGTSQRFFCITRPRRFGKSVMADMVAAFFGKKADSKELFDSLEIASPRIMKQLKRDSGKDYDRYLNQYDVIYIDFSEIPEHCNSYHAYINRILSVLKRDIQTAFPEYYTDSADSIWDILTAIYQENRQRFIFVLDEWDAIFHMDFITEADKKAYLLFLKSLLKGRVYAELVYMTGILPIAKYSDGSELNMFVEYNMATTERFSQYFGFSSSEVDRLYAIYQQSTDTPRFTRDDLRIWYDGYYSAGKERLYNPRSIVCALTDNQLRNYWTSSGIYDSIFHYIKNHENDMQDDLAILFAGECIPSDIQEYAATAMQLDTKDEIYSALVVYGLLTYKEGLVSIPNHELMDSFASMMKKERSLGYIYNLANVSRKMLSATLSGNTQEMAEILSFAHNTESPIFSYNSEIELSAIVNLVYLAARDNYRVEREDKAGEGYVDFIFYPDQKNQDAFILELKVDSTPDDAIRQIKDKEYVLRFKGKLGEKTKYTGRILAVGISYDKKMKKHSCKVEELSEI
ncbi:MAG: ATP-binding protein [Lachnospiraceae bacterium]